MLKGNYTKFDLPFVFFLVFSPLSLIPQSSLSLYLKYDVPLLCLLFCIENENGIQISDTQPPKEAVDPLEATILRNSKCST